MSTARAAKVGAKKRRLVGLRIDIETRSRVPVKSGSYRYSECPDFAVLVISYAPVWEHPDGRVGMAGLVTLDLTDDAKVRRFQKLLADERVTKYAYNANFERVCLSRWAGKKTGDYFDPAGWECTAVRANVNGVQGSLDEVARELRSPIAKDPEGRRLINLLSIPDRRTGQFHDTGDECWCGQPHSEDFAKFEDYCERDVLTEATVSSRLNPIPEDVQRQYELDQRINDRGVRHHRKLSEQAVAQVEVEKNRVLAELKALTGVDNPNSGPQLSAWLAAQGYPMDSLSKEFREEALGDPLIPDHVAEALTLKGGASLSSVAKHQAALNTRSADGRIRGSLQFYGAHTGREAGRGIQPQNLPRYQAPDEDRRALLRGVAGLEAPRIAKGTVRASLVPARGCVFVTCDYNAIEARVLAGLAGETWAEDEFRGQGKIYEATAATMFGVDKDALIRDLSICGKCGGDSCPACVTRGKGKVSNLALGYGGGAGALVTMGAEAAGIDVGNFPDLYRDFVRQGRPGGKFHEWNREAHDYPELLNIRDAYRDASPMTTRFWKLCAKAWDVAATTGNGAQFGQFGSLTMLRDGRDNRLVLPSGRSIWYRDARSHRDLDRPDRVDRRTYRGKGKGRGHIRVDTHGGKLTENVTQAVARDVLFDLLEKIEAKTAQGWPGRVVLHVHDEVVLEVPKNHADEVLADTIGLMSQSPDWGKFLIVKGEGEIMERYGK